MPDTVAENVAGAGLDGLVWACPEVRKLLKMHGRSIPNPSLAKRRSLFFGTRGSGVRIPPPRPY